MRKELIISTIPQETRVAVLENDELVEFLIERHRTQNIAGNIYKGRVTKVLPGMQSAFVNIGLDRDAFLYVSDFFEDTDEYERVVASAEEDAIAESEKPRSVGRGKTPRPEKPVEKTERPESEPSESVKSSDRPSPRRRGEKRERKPRIPSLESREAESDSRETRPPRETREARSPRGPRDEERRQGSIQLLPGESLAKYADEVVSDPNEVAESELEQVIGETEEQHLLEQFPREARMPVADQDAGLYTTENGQPDTTEKEPVEEETASNDRPGSKTDPVVTEETSPSDGASGEASSVPEVQEEVNEEKPIATPEPADASTAEASAAGVDDTSETKIDEGPALAESDSPAEESDSGEEGESRTARIADRRDKRTFSRRPPARRPRRRSPAKSESSRAGSGSRGPTISDLLQEGQEILVQVSKEPLGKKGARITSHIALPGRYIVYMPTVDHIGVSRKISSEDERARLRRIINENREDLPGGFIVRTAGEGKDEKELIQDLRFLGSLWGEIRSGNERNSAPALIHSDLNLVQRVLRDQLSEEFKAIRLDSETEYEKVLEFVNRFQPDLVNRVRLHLKDNSIFEEYGLQQEIDKALRSKVWLKSGGYIVVNQTEALVAIDVNTGKFVGKSNRLEDTIVRTNMDAVHEIVRQIRLRNLGGIIVVDFIDMEERKNRQRVMLALEEELRKDRSPSKILQFNDFGLVAITRKRTQPSLERVLGSPCPRCAGSGFVKAVETVCYEILQEVKKMLSEIDGPELTVRVSPDVAKALKSGDYIDLTEMEDETKTDIRIQSDPLLHAEHFDIF
jgi:ribonuclease G